MNFVIFGQARTGSSFFFHLLQSHPQLQCDGELLGVHLWRRGIRRYLLKIVRRFPEPYILWKATKSPQPIYGFKLFVNQTTATSRVISTLKNHGWQIIHIQRRGLFDIALSKTVAFLTNHYVGYKQSDQLDEVCITIPPERFAHQIEQCINLRRRELDALKGVPHFQVTYEDDLLNEADRNRICGAIFKALQIEPLPVSTARSHSWNRPYSELVVNYSELQAFMQTTTGRALQTAWDGLFEAD